MCLTQGKDPKDVYSPEGHATTTAEPMTRTEGSRVNRPEPKLAAFPETKNGIASSVHTHRTVEHDR